jgi:hypothetical protein
LWSKNCESINQFIRPVMKTTTTTTNTFSASSGTQAPSIKMADQMYHSPTRRRDHHTSVGYSLEKGFSGFVRMKNHPNVLVKSNTNGVSSHQYDTTNSSPVIIGVKKHGSRPHQSSDSVIIDSQKVSLYHTLGIPLGSSKDVIRKAYHRLCLECHPDKQLGPFGTSTEQTTAERFQIINDAYHVLINSC